MRAILAASALLLASCHHRSVLVDGRIGLSVIAPNNPLPGIRSDFGPLHAGVIEFLLAGPEGPLRSYYTTALEQAAPSESSGGLMSREGSVGLDLDQLEEAVLAELEPGRLATGADFARMRARRLAAHIQEALSQPPGIVIISCCRTVDPANGRFATRSETQAPLSMQILRSQRGQAVQLIWSNALSSEHLTYDLSAVPHAFELGGALDAATVEKTIVALHEPRTTAAR